MRRVLAGLATTLIAVAAAACASGDTAATTTAGPANKAPVTLRLQVTGEPDETAVFDTIASEYKRANPNVTVEIERVANEADHLAKLATGFAGGAGPDLFVLNYRTYSQFAARRAIEPVGPRLQSLGLNRADYFEPPLDGFTYAGQLQCMPQNVSSLVVYWNRTLFAKAGLPAPPASWTWADFRQTAIKLTGGGVRGLGLEPRIIRVAPFVWANGGRLVDDGVKPARFTLEEPSSRAALEYLVGLVRDAKVVPTQAETAAQALDEQFAAGKLGMFLSSRRDTPGFREIVSLDWDVAALPLSPSGGRAGVLHSDAYCVARTTKNTDAAFSFVGFAAGEPGQTLAAFSGRTVPSRKAIAESNLFLDPVKPPPSARVFLDTIPILRATPVISTWPEIEAEARKVLTKAFYEPGYSIDLAIKELDERSRPLFLEAARSG